MNRSHRDSRRTLRRIVVAIAVLTLGGWALVEAEDGATITALGNEGFLIECSETEVVVDGFYRGLRGYVAPTDDQRRSREEAAPPFDEVDVVLSTHHHADHFDAGVMTGFLLANSDAILVSTPTVVGLLRGHDSFHLIADRTRAAYPSEGETWVTEVSGVEVEVLNLHHGRGRRPPIENLGFVINLGACSVLHIGDTEATPAELEALDLPRRKIDIAFIPYWHLLDPDGAAAYLEAIGAKTVVAMHLPAEDAPPGYLDPAKDLDDLILMIETAVPGAVVFGEIMEKKKIRTGGLLPTGAE